jgi:8-hydroxy-5-deazaflavin:NADPH oxidoreductase
MADEPDVRHRVIGILGGTAGLGHALAFRLAAAGVHVLIGSRAPGRAATKADELRRMLAAAGSVRAGQPVSGRIGGAGNAEAASAADLVIVAVPYDGHAALLTGLRDELAGKIVVDCVNPLGFDAKGPYALPIPDGSAAQQAAALLPDSRVVAAFHHVSAPLLMDPMRSQVDTDVLVLGDDRDATDTVQALAAAIPGMRGIYGGRLRNAGQVEAMTANLIAINRRYKAHAGIRVTDV